MLGDWGEMKIKKVLKNIKGGFVYKAGHYDIEKKGSTPFTLELVYR